MPRVPQYQRQVVEQAQPFTPGDVSGAFGVNAWGNAARTGQQLQRAGSELMDIAAEEQQRDDIRQAKNVYLDATRQRQQLLNGDGGLLSRSGNNAEGIYTTARQQMETIRTSAMKRLNGERQQRLFADMWDNDAAQTSGQVLKYQNEQLRQGEIGTTKALADQHVNEGVVASTDLYAVQPSGWQESYAIPGWQGALTKLDPEEEAAFQQWAGKNKVPVTDDYDMRGFWKNSRSKKGATGVNKNDGKLHFTDEWKTPLHESFSGESRYARKDIATPQWNKKDQLVGPDGKVLFDEPGVYSQRNAVVLSNEKLAADTRSLAALQGWSPEVTEAYYRKKLTERDIGVINALLARKNASGAQTYYDEHRENIPGVMRAKVEDVLGQAKLTADTMTEADRIQSRGLDYGGQQAAAAKIQNPSLREQVAKELDIREHRRAYVEQERRTERDRSAWNSFAQLPNPSLADIPVGVSGNMRVQMEQRVWQKASGVMLDDRATRHELQMMPVEEFVNVDLNRYASRLKYTSSKEFEALQQQIRAGDEKARQRYENIRTSLAMANAALDAAGLATNGLKGDDLAEVNGRRNDFLNKLQTEIKAKEIKDDPEAVQDIIDRMLIRGEHTKGWNTPAFSYERQAGKEWEPNVDDMTNDPQLGVGWVEETDGTKRFYQKDTGQWFRNVGGRWVQETGVRSAPQAEPEPLIPVTEPDQRKPLADLDPAKVDAPEGMPPEMIGQVLKRLSEGKTVRVRKDGVVRELVYRNGRLEFRE